MLRYVHWVCKELANVGLVRIPNNFSMIISDHVPKSMYTSDGPSSLPSISNLKLQAQRSDRHSNCSDDEPLYDAVASDDDYAALAPAQQVILARIKNFKMNSIG